MIYDMQGTTALAPPQEWWTVEDVAEYRNVNVITVYKWVKDARDALARGENGGIPFSQAKLHSAIRFRPEAVRAYFGDSN